MGQQGRQPCAVTNEQKGKEEIMSEIFPELRHLKGGKKQSWINEHLTVIAALHNELGFEVTRELLNMKSDTLVRALSLSERRPAITQAEKAMNRALRAEGKANDALGELEVQSEVLQDQITEISDLKDNLARYFDVQGQLNTMMSKLISSVKRSRNLTYHINSKSNRKVGPSNRIGKGRPFLSNSPKRRKR